MWTVSSNLEVKKFLHSSYCLFEIFITWLPNKYFLRTSLNIRYIFPKHFAINMFRKIKQEGFIELQRHNIKLESFIWLFSSAKWGEIGSVEWNLKSHWFLCYFAESISYQTIWFQNSSFKKKSLCKQFGKKELKNLDYYCGWNSIPIFYRDREKVS